MRLFLEQSLLSKDITIEYKGLEKPADTLSNLLDKFMGKQIDQEEKEKTQKSP